jgi:hypothetical protein
MLCVAAAVGEAGVCPAATLLRVNAPTRRPTRNVTRTVVMPVSTVL